MLCRDVGKGEAVDTIRGARGELVVAPIDLSDFESIRRYCRNARPGSGRRARAQRRCSRHPRVTTVDGLELNGATNSGRPFPLTHLLWSRLRSDARVVHVSSGGMYSQKLDVQTLFDPPEPFDGVVAYARTKRAQVVLTEPFNERSTLRVSAMHPGWADTPGVQSSLPRFRRVTKAILRTPAEGADTIVWLAASPAAAHPKGRFIDRAPRPTHLSRRTEESAAERRRRRALCVRIGLDPAASFR
ncbi:MAG: hypothetical protein R3B99_10725 [Polyangiales bacterium]